MSIDCTSNVWKLSSGSKNQLLLMLAIADYADDSQYCWPGQEKLAERLRMTERGVRNLIAEMCESGDLWKARRGSVQSSNAYIVLVGITQQQLSSAADKADAHNCDSAFLRALLFRMVSDNILELTPEVTRELIKLIEDREVKEEKFSAQTGTIFPLKPERSFLRSVI